MTRVAVLVLESWQSLAALVLRFSIEMHVTSRERCCVYSCNLQHCRSVLRRVLEEPLEYLDLSTLSIELPIYQHYNYTILYGDYDRGLLLGSTAQNAWKEHL